MDAGFTKGPWVAVNFRADGFLVVRETPTAEANERVCVAYVGNEEPYRGTPLPAKANARLVASAPDLFDALTKVRAIISEGAAVGFNPHDGDWAERLFASQAFSHAAVTKATGETK